MFEKTFEKNLDGIEDHQIKIRGIAEYTMSFAEREFTLFEYDKENGSMSEFTEADTDYSNDLTKSDFELESD